jgi:hypothetical protein
MHPDELDPVRRVPAEAYLAADAVMDYELDERDRNPEAPDELWLALRSAGPHIRLDEIDQVLDLVRTLPSVTALIVALQERRLAVLMAIGSRP